VQDDALKARFPDGAVMVRWGLPDGADEPLWHSHRLEELADQLACVPLGYSSDKIHKVGCCATAPPQKIRKVPYWMLHRNRNAPGAVLHVCGCCQAVSCAACVHA
jgi:hypothetical protein